MKEKKKKKVMVGHASVNQLLFKDGERPGPRSLTDGWQTLNHKAFRYRNTLASIVRLLLQGNYVGK